MAFSQIPKNARSRPSPFKVEIPEEQLEEFKTLLRLSKIGPKTFEGEQADGRFGITREWLINAKAKWEKWDWRKYEQRINSVPNFKIPIKDGDDTFDIHFMALFSQKENATPLLFLHGWPGNFMEFHSIVQILSKKYTPETLPYQVIVPSLPGYAFSSPPPLTRDFDTRDVARLMNSLMHELGFGSGYIVQGGDIGAKVARILAVKYEEAKAVHLNFCMMTQPDKYIDKNEINEQEKKGIERLNDFVQKGSAYAFFHGTKPSTIGLVLSASPISLLAWIGEKFLAWTDKDPELDDILGSVTLYWLTDTFPRSIYPYRERFAPTQVMAESPDWHIKKPFGFSWFPKELSPVPKSCIAITGDLTFWRQHESGGHFAALEKPDVLLEDVEAFVAQVWDVKGKL